MRVQCTVRELHSFTQDEIMGMVSKEALELIRRRDRAPEIRAYAIAHEGPARGRLVGVGTVAINYARGVIRQLAEKVKAGTSVFYRHGESNDHGGRERIGEIVGSALKEIGGKLYAVAAVYVNPDRRAQALDVASIEADMEFVDRGGSYEAAEVAGVSGLALSESTRDSPGFPGARLLGAAAFFVTEVDYSNPSQNDFIPDPFEDRPVMADFEADRRWNDFIP